MITTDTPLILRHLDTIHALISNSYWAKQMPKVLLEKAIQNSLSFMYLDEEGEFQGFCRVITDYATFAYLADVIVEESARGKGVGKAIVQAVVEHPELQGLRRFMLATFDAHTLYEKFGFAAVPDPSILMQICHPTIYSDLQN
ncbi:GNAT family N-acetyltransferase [Pseudoalteromonas sp. GCY]|uniref:GNAT family N-acetyltransferase n=1 Tax=Pseudoalteromonas sp. GCY TaxID=2003316 RepID=UPI000BFEFBFD|nr:GNAT family N-acetyltransferase [Pseudoalteromonas sp. GCY]PHI39037.1 GNAT family N-acetyltransferase [Pseudoalteromonas sp. GCY]QQQ65236.1 GNAT family N-acetyltransferase [Pseudoalteromonas sp. GCY]